MSSRAKFTERETGIVVDVYTPLQWEPYEMVSVVRYPNGSEFALPSRELTKFFDVVTPQEIFVEANGYFSRPTESQRAQK